MKHRKEDELMRCAFGELSREEEERLRAQADNDPIAAQKLRAYDRLRTDLRSMADVPEEQLSVDRLRDAILARGLEHAPVERPRKWFWMPATAMALAFGIMMVRPMMTTPAADVVLTSNTGKAPEVVLNAPTQEDVTPAPMVATEPKEEKKVLVASNEPRRSTNRRVRRAARVEEPVVAMASTMSAATEIEEAKEEPRFDVEASQAPPPPVEMASTPLVVIEQVPSETGAMAAREVARYSDVLVGG